MALSPEKIVSRMRGKLGKTKPVVGFRSPFQVLISTILSQRTRDENTALASENLFSKYPSPQKLAKAPLSQIKKLIKPSGFYNEKAKKVKSVSGILLKKYKGKVPQSIEELTLLPGVGRKTANCVLVFAFSKPAIPVDTHVHRISNRLGIVKTKTPEQTEQALRAYFPKHLWLPLNELMVKYGRRICKPISPKCGECPLAPECPSSPTKRSGAIRP